MLLQNSTEKMKLYSSIFSFFFQQFEAQNVFIFILFLTAILYVLIAENKL